MIKTSYYQDLTKMNTFGMKVKARCFMEYDSVADLVDIEFEELARPVLHIGGGSNLLFTDDFKGTVLHSKINFIEILGECQCVPETPSPEPAAAGFSLQRSTGPFAESLERVGKCPLHTNGTSSEDVDSSDSGPENASEVVLVSVGAGVVFDDFCAWAAKEGLWGVENLSYIPGEVGASAVQNIGAYGVEVKDVIHRVYCYDTVEEEFVHFSVEECGYGYRDSIFKHPEIKGRYIVTHVVFALSREPKPCLEYGHLKEAAAGFSLQRSTGPFAESLERVGKCPLHTNGTSPESVIRFEAVTPALIRKVIIKIRKEKLPEPSVKGSAGSFFKNPVVSAEHFARIEAAAKAEHGPDYKVPHYVIECQCVPETPSHSVGPSPEPAAAGFSLQRSTGPFAESLERVGKCPLHTNGISTPEERYTMIKIPAAWMIEQCGWKGKRSGGAAVWEKQPLVIVNYTGDAYPEEIIGLEKRIIASVKAKFGVDLHPEVEHV